MLCVVGTCLCPIPPSFLYYRPSAAPKLISTRNDTQDNSELAELQPPKTTELNEESIIPSKSRLSHQDSPLDNSTIPEDSPLKSPPLNEEIALDKSPNINEEISYLRPPSPTCSSTDEYSDSDSDQEPPIIQLPGDLEYEKPPLDWSDMDPAQRLTWLREHQLPNQKPSKLILTNLQDLTRRQITNLKKIKRPKSFHVQSSKDQINQQRIETDFESSLSTLIATPTKTPQSNLTSPGKRNDQDQLENPNETKKQKLEDKPSDSATNNDPLPQPPTPFIDGTTTFDPSQTENDPNEQPQTNKRKHLIQQHYSNENSQETKKQRLPHGPESQITSELPTTHPFTPNNIIVTEDISIPTDPLLETLTIQTFFQMQPQPQTIKSTSNEASLDSLIQDHIDTVTRGFNPHAGPTVEKQSEPPLIQHHSPNNIAHEIPYQEHATTPHNYESELPPDVWARMSDKQRRHHTTRTRQNRNKKTESHKT